MFQKYFILGRLVEDSVQRFTSGEQATSVENFRVITSEKVKGKEYKFAISVSLWGKLGVSIHKYLNKGQLVLVEGKLKQEQWEKDGVKYYKTSVTAENIRLLGGKSVDPVSSSTAASTASPQPTPEQPQQQNGATNDPFAIDF